MKHWLISLSVAAALSSVVCGAFALPTVADVQTEIQKGNYTQAQTMMRKVVEAKPGSAKAHYIYAEILAHNARFTDAAEQARIAKQIDPAAGFTTPEKFRSFQQLLDREQQAGRTSGAAPSSSMTPQPRQSSPAPAALPAPVEQRSGGGIPIWVWVGAAAILFIGWKMLTRRAGPAAMGMGAGPVAAYNGAPAGFNNAPGYGGGQGPGAGYPPGGGMMQQPRTGSGLMGVGLAAAGGAAAGMLAEKYLSGNHNGGNTNPALDNAGNFAGGGNSFASPERDQAAQDLEQRDVDFGSGNDWNDGGGASDAGSFDSGGSGGGSDDW